MALPISPGSQNHSLSLLEDQIIPVLSQIIESSIIAPILSLKSGSEGTARDGKCGNDSFEVFGFLAFGLYLLNLVMNMDGGARKKRSSDQCSSEFDHSIEPALMEGALAFYSMFEGFLNAFYDGEGKNLNQIKRISKYIKLQTRHAEILPFVRLPEMHLN